MPHRIASGFYDDDWIRKLKDLIPPQSSAYYDEVDRLRNMCDYGGLSKQIEDLSRSCREHEEMIKRIADPLSENVRALASALRAPLQEVNIAAQNSEFYDALHMANKAIAGIMDKSAVASTSISASLPDLKILTRYSAIGEISLAAQETMSGINFAYLSGGLGISPQELASLEGEFRGFTESYASVLSHK